MFVTLLTLALAAASTAPLDIPAEVGNGDLFVARPAAGAAVPDEIRFLDQAYRPIDSPGGRDVFFLIAVDLGTVPGSQAASGEGQEGAARAESEQREAYDHVGKVMPLDDGEKPGE